MPTLRLSKLCPSGRPGHFSTDNRGKPVWHSVVACWGMRNFSALSDIEFEGLVADLLAAELSTSVERFTAGRDGGVDLRWKVASGGIGIGQCKHYLRSSFSQLVAAARAEVPRVKHLQPTDYRFVTSFDLSVGQKDQLHSHFRCWMAGPDCVIGGRDLDGLLTRHESVERRHAKLWLATGSQLFWSVHSDLANRASALRDRVASCLPRYVVNRGYERARDLLEKHRVCVIAGVPGIGKTMLAYVLLADAMTLGYEPVEVSADIEEAWIALDGSKLQVFLYDDFLGQLSFGERLGKNEDRRLADFVAKVRSMRTKRLIMTTREYILQDARQTYDCLNALDRRLHFVLALQDYTRGDRARILYNHLWHADVSVAALREIAAGGYKAIVDHPGYSPRLVDHCTGPAFDTVTKGYARRVVEILDHPSQLWRIGFERHLRVDQQLVVVTLATLPPRTAVDDLQVAHRALCERLSVPCTGALFRSALVTMEGTFVAIERVENTPSVRFHNPSIREFALDWLAEDHQSLAALVESAVFFEQLRQLHTQTTERMGQHGGTASRSGFHALLSGMRRQFVDAIARTIGGPSPERRSEWDHSYGQMYRPPSGWFENRLECCLSLPNEWKPDNTWLVGQIKVLRDHWNAHEGGKSEAVLLLRHLRAAKRRVDRSSDEFAGLTEVVDEASAALDQWLASTLDETEEDWVPYLERLERDHRSDLASDTELAARFEAFARDELQRWSPSPPNIEMLLAYANKFGATGLIEALEEKIEEDRSRDDNIANMVKPSTPASMPPSTDDSDDALEALFRRLARR